MLKKNVLAFLLIVFIAVGQLGIFALLTYLIPEGLLSVIGLFGILGMPIFFISLSVYVLKKVFPNPSK